MNNMGKRIKETREKKNLSVEKVAKRMKIEPQQLLDWESGTIQPDAESAGKLANILGVSSKYILFGMDNASGIHTMFPSRVGPQPAGKDAILALVSALLLFMGVGGLVMLIVMTGSRLVTAGELSFWEFFILSGSIYSAVAFIVIAVIGAVVGLISLAMMRNKKKNSKGKRK